MRLCSISKTGFSALSSIALALSLTGCGLGTLDHSVVEAPLTGATLQGNVHGGEQGVQGSTIQLYAVGSGGYGVGATALITGAAVKTDQFGSFSITGAYTCPSASTLVYITATGGNPGLAAGTNNPAIKLMSALGQCGNLNANTYLTVNEVTTAAAAFALGQFFTPTFGSASTDGIGSPASTQAKQGLANAFATVPNLVNQLDGTAVVSATLTGAAGTVTTTPESAKLYTVADILAACVNSDGGSASACQTTLFPDVVPTGGTAPTDTLQAAVYLSLNPTSNNANGSAANLMALYGLQTPQSPFVGVTTQPNDWTIGINYSAGTSATQTTINQANGIAIDSLGDVWIINLNTSATATESMTEFSPTGTPLANPFNGGGAAGPTTMSASSPRNIAIDTLNDVFATSSSGSSYTYEYSAAGVPSSFSIGGQGYGIAIDGNNNIFISHNSSSSNTFGFDEYTADTLATTNQIRYPFDSATTLNQYLAVGTNGNIYETRGSANSTSLLQASGLNPGTCTTYPCTITSDPSLNATYTTIATGTITNPYGLATAANGGLWVADNGVSSVTYVANGVGTSFGSATSFTTPRFVAVDGNNNAWFTNRGTASLSEITPAGTILSPVQVTNGTTTTGSIGFNHAGMSSQAGVAIDPSGNVWVANGTNSSATNDPNSLFELVGAAAPTVTPIALALKNGTVGAKP